MMKRWGVNIRGNQDVAALQLDTFRMMRLVTTPPSSVIVGKAKDRLLAVGAFTPLQNYAHDFIPVPVGPEHAFLPYIAVAKNQRKRGIGKQLVEAICQQAKNRGFQCLHLNCLPEVTSFWEKCGFSKLSDDIWSWPGMFVLYEAAARANDNIAMVKDLAR